MQNTTFNVQGMDCADEVAAVDRALRSMTGVNDIQVNLVLGTVTVDHDTASTAAIITALGKVGLRASIQQGNEARDTPGTATQDNSSGTTATSVPRTSLERQRLFDAQRGHLYAVVISGVLTGIGLLVEWLVVGLATWIPIVLYAVATVAGAWYVAPKALRSLRHLTLDMNMLMTVAVIGAAIIGEWAEGASVAFLFALSELLESYSLARARRAIRSLLDIAPATALVQDGDVQREVRVEDVAVGATVIVRSGMNIPLDGVVIKGESTVNQAPITGESTPAAKATGDTVYAGTINEDGFLEVRVTSVSSKSILARIVQMIGAAQAQKAPSERFVDTFAKYYTPAVFVFALSVLLVPPLLFGSGWQESIYRSLVLIVIACPCALVISTPISIVSGLTAMARRGVLVKGGAHIEEVGRLKVLAVDKTGTITSGKPTVHSVTPWRDNDEVTVVRIAAAVDSYSEHPLARAIVAYATGRGIDAPESSGYKAISGKGAEADVEGKRYFASNHRYAHDMGVCTPDLETALAEIESQGLSVVVVGQVGDSTSGVVLGIIAIGDTIRADAVATIQALHSVGIKKVVIISGDNQRTVNAIAKQAGIDEAFGDQLPEDKVERIRSLVAEYKHVGMVGDGVNDAPAMAIASIGIAMGGVGTDAAIETADIALVQDELRKIPEVIRLGQRTARIIKVNIAFALGLKALFLVLAFAGVTSLWLAILADTGATLLVISNALRLLQTPKADIA
ncbi:MAG: cation-translocating P-type ATPase [Ignavibacteria bacterium]|nr:cation-translocating P-type ATPase [Ignavibacteria bacterium]MBK9182057.1 cation-translocating P-type ATPase [Ignavibacteria bacterium]